MFKRVAKEKQLRVRQVFKNLSLRIWFMKSDIILNSRLNVF